MCNILFKMYRMYRMYLSETEALNIRSIDLHNEVSRLEAMALLPVPDSFHHRHFPSVPSCHYTEPHPSALLTLCQGDRHKLSAPQPTTCCWSRRWDAASRAAAAGTGAAVEGEVRSV